MEEKTLVKQASGGDKEAFAALYLLYRDELYRYALFRLKNEEDARDAVSSCVIAAYEGVYSLRSYGAFKSWIFRILYRSCCRLMTEQSERNRRADSAQLDTLPATSDSIPPELQEALSILSDEDCNIVLLSVIAGYNSSEIASLTGMKASTVRSRLKRALAKMKEFLE